MIIIGYTKNGEDFIYDQCEGAPNANSIMAALLSEKSSDMEISEFWFADRVNDTEYQKHGFVDR